MRKRPPPSLNFQTRFWGRKNDPGADRGVDGKLEREEKRRRRGRGWGGKGKAILVSAIENCALGASLHLGGNNNEASTCIQFGQGFRTVDDDDDDNNVFDAMI